MSTVTSNVFDVERNLAAAARQWPALHALCDDAAVYRARAEGVSGWSVDQHVYHCGIALGLIAGAIEGMLANPQQGAGLAPTHPFALPMLQGAPIPRGVAKAPDFLVPPDAPAADDSRAVLCGARAKWEALEGRRTGIESCPATFAHFALGNFTSAQWARFTTLHTAHHLKIVRDILNASGLKAPYSGDVENLS